MRTPRETAVQKRARVSMLLADYDVQSRQLRKLFKDVESMKLKIRDEVEPGQYGEWTYAEGTPREILDQKAAKDLLTEKGVVIPTKMTEAPVIVTHSGGKK